MISKTKKKCKVDGCSSLLFGKGFCSFHYKMEKVKENKGLKKTVSVISIENEGKYYHELKHKTEFETIDELFDWYDNFYLPRTYNILFSELIPEARNQMEELLDR